MLECPAVAVAEIERLQAKGYRLTLDEIVWLASLGERVENPRRAASPFLAGVPVVAGCEPFFRLTNQASWWLELAKDWFPPHELGNALAFAHRFGRTQHAFDGLLQPGAARQAVHSWHESLTCTDDEMLDALDRLIASDAPHRPAGRQQDQCRTLAQAEAITGIKREDWATRTPEEMHAAIIEGLKAFAEHGTGEADEIASASREALADLSFASEEIERRHAARVKANG